LSNAKQQVGEIWVRRREKGLCITLHILESRSPASAHAASKGGLPSTARLLGGLWGALGPA